MSDDVNELQKEWRAIVLTKLNNLESSQTDLRKDIADIKMSFTQTAEFLALKAEVEKLKEFKAKALGIILALNAVVAFVGWAGQVYYNNKFH